MEFNNNLVDEKFLDKLNELIGVPTKEQLDAYNYVIENRACADILENLYHYFVDKEPLHMDEFKQMLEYFVKDKTPEEALETIKQAIHCDIPEEVSDDD